MWQAISEDAVMSLIAYAEASMEPSVSAFWELIRIRPVKWNLPPWGDMGGGFWVVAVVGQDCIWYNDIEEGFNIGPFDTFGRIADYRCSQSKLQHCLTYFIERFMEAVGGRV